MYLFGKKNEIGSGMTALKISNGGMNDIMKIVKSLKKLGISMKSVSETIQDEVKEEKGGFFGILLGTLGASLLGKMLTSKRHN